MIKTTPRVFAVTAMSAALMCGVASRAAQGMYSDPAIQAKSVTQVLAGVSPSVGAWSRPDYADLSRDHVEALIWWAPGTQLALYPWLRAGLTVAHAVRIVAILAIALGSIGWVHWFAAFELPTAWTVTYAAALPWTRFVSNNMFLYGSDVLAFALVPWVFAVAVAAARRESRGLAVCAGICAGSLYILKYSAAFVTAAIAMLFVVRAVMAPVPLRPLRIRVAAAVSGAAVAPIALLSALNHQAGASNLLTATFSPVWSWRTIVHAVAVPALAAADLDATLRFALMHPSRPLLTDVFWISAIGLPGGVCLALLVRRCRVQGLVADLARTVLLVTIGCLTMVWTVSSAVSIEARHAMAAGFCVLPLALAEGRRWWRESAPAARAMMAFGCACYVAVPAMYGVASVSAKAVRFPARYRPATSGLYNPLLATDAAADVVSALQRSFDANRDVWYVTEPMTALDLRGRTIVRHADFMTRIDLERDRFVTSRPVRIHVLLPPRFESNGKGAVIRASFPQAAAWQRERIEGSEYDRWIADLRPATGE